MIMMAKWYSGTLGPKASWHLSYRWGKTPKKSHPGNLSRPGIESGPAAWQARMLPPVPQWWTPSLAVRQNVLSSPKTTKRHSTLQSTLSRHQSSHAWCCHGVSGSLARDTRALSPAASWQFPMFLGDTADATCAWISFIDAVWEITAAHTMCQSWCASVLHDRRESGLWCVRMFHRWLLKAATCHRYIVPIMCSNPSTCSSSFPHAYNATSFKWLKLFNRSMYSLAGHSCTLEWMLQTLFTSQSTTVTACRIKIEGAKTGLLNAIWLPMTVTIESLILQLLRMHILYPGNNEHSHWGCCIIFPSSVYGIY